MTTVAALVKGDRVYMAADRMSNTEDGYVHSLAESKLIHHVATGLDILITSSGLRRVMQELRCEWQPPPYREQGWSDDEYIHELTVSLERHFKEIWDVVHDRDNDQTLDAVIMVAFHGRIWIVSPDFVHCGITDSYAAIGSGVGQAQGVLYALQNRNVQPSVIVQEAVACAIHHIAGMGPPIDVMVV